MNMEVNLQSQVLKGGKRKHQHLETMNLVTQAIFCILDFCKGKL